MVLADTKGHIANNDVPFIAGCSGQRYGKCVEQRDQGVLCQRGTVVHNLIALNPDLLLW